MQVQKSHILLIISAMLVFQGCSHKEKAQPQVNSSSVPLVSGGIIRKTSNMETAEEAPLMTAGLVTMGGDSIFSKAMSTFSTSTNTDRLSDLLVNMLGENLDQNVAKKNLVIVVANSTDQGLSLGNFLDIPSAFQTSVFNISAKDKKWTVVPGTANRKAASLQIGTQQVDLQNPTNTQISTVNGNQAVFFDGSKIADLPLLKLDEETVKKTNPVILDLAKAEQGYTEPLAIEAKMFDDNQNEQTDCFIVKLPTTDDDKVFFVMNHVVNLQDNTFDFSKVEKEVLEKLPHDQDIPVTRACVVVSASPDQKQNAILVAQESMSIKIVDTPAPVEAPTKIKQVDQMLIDAKLKQQSLSQSNVLDDAQLNQTITIKKDPPPTVVKYQTLPPSTSKKFVIPDEVLQPQTDFLKGVAKPDGTPEGTTPVTKKKVETAVVIEKKETPASEKRTPPVVKKEKKAPTAAEIEEKKKQNALKLQKQKEAADKKRQSQQQPQPQPKQPPETNGPRRR